MFARHEVHLGVGVAITDRAGGVSRPPYDELNLGDHVGDDLGAVAANRERLRAATGVADLVFMRQVHGATVAVLDAAPREPPEADALVTRTAGVALAVLVADCAPVLLWDAHAGVVAAAHAGRRGLAVGVLPATVSAMATLGAQAERISALIGPSICAEHYEVPAGLRDAVAAVSPAAAARTRQGAAALDIAAGLAEQLRTAGLRDCRVLPECTAETSGCYSYRRDGVTGRFAGVVWRQP